MVWSRESEGSAQVIQASPIKRVDERVPHTPQLIRIAAYARISVADREAMQFSSIQAQVEAITAYAKSQASQGWEMVGEPYIDDGVSGSTTNRPALTRLLDDVVEGRIDVVIVHRFDRFSRSQRDFLNMLHMLEANQVSFVSVTQALDTGTPMGRCMLSVITAFGQMEREVIAERTRDKVRAARSKGLWTGGRPVLGYDVIDKRLVVNPKEAARVREIFALYLQWKSLLGVTKELAQRGWNSKLWINKKGELVGGNLLTKNSLRGLLTNPLYLGKVRCGDELSDGAHEAIVDEATWDAVQELLKSNGNRTGRTGSNGRNKWNALLQGIVKCGVCGAAFTSHHCKKGSRSYSYYVCQTHQKQGQAACPGSRIAAGKLESFVVDQLREIGRDPQLLAATLDADHAIREARKPELVGQAKRAATAKSKLTDERANILGAIANGDGNSVSLAEHLEELDVKVAGATRTEADARAELRALDLSDVSAGELREVLSDLEPVWSELFPNEKARAIALLLERVEFDANAEEVEITFRPGGPQQFLNGGGVER